MSKSQRTNVLPDLRIKPATVRIPGGRASDRATAPGYNVYRLIDLQYMNGILLLNQQNSQQTKSSPDLASNKGYGPGQLGSANDADGKSRGIKETVNIFFFLEFYEKQYKYNYLHFRLPLNLQRQTATISFSVVSFWCFSFSSKR